MGQVGNLRADCQSAQPGNARRRALALSRIYRVFCFAAGITTRAFFLNSASVGRTAGSRSIARRI